MMRVKSGAGSRAKTTLYPEYNIGEAVHMDGCAELTGYVTAFLFRESAIMYEVSWITDSHSKSDYFPAWRLTLKPRD
jgi:hypothetical protein